MTILVVAATDLEIPLLASGPRGQHSVDVLVTGVGMVATAAQTARRLAQARYDLALNFGLCGSFDRSLGLGTVVHITSDRLSELGAEDGDSFVSMRALGLASEDDIVNGAPPENGPLGLLPRVTAITVNTVHGNDRTIEEIVRRCRPQVESMEGAAFAYACTISSVPYAQVRAVSNVVERRNRDAWRLDLAIGNLNDVAVKIVQAA
jgi:futalosine hydrolase